MLLSDIITKITTFTLRLKNCADIYTNPLKSATLNGDFNYDSTTKQHIEMIQNVLSTKQVDANYHDDIQVNKIIDVQESKMKLLHSIKTIATLLKTMGYHYMDTHDLPTQADGELDTNILDTDFNIYGSNTINQLIKHLDTFESVIQSFETQHDTVTQHTSHIKKKYNLLCEAIESDSTTDIDILPLLVPDIIRYYNQLAHIDNLTLHQNVKAFTDICNEFNNTLSTKIANA